ncbi:MAG: hypothetical protein ACE5HL_08060 [Terriglobia bacterium]
MRRSIAASCLGLSALLLALSAGAQTRATVTVRLIDTLSTGSSQPGDTFTATLATPLVVNDRIVAEPGTRVSGRVREVVSSGRLKRPAAIRLRLQTVHAPAGRIPLQTGDLTIKAGSHATRNLLIIGGAVGAGTAIGGAAGGAKGAAIGAAAGAGAGITGAYLTGKREIVLPPETTLSFHVTSVTISAQELARLQRVGHRAGDAHAVALRRRHHDEDDDEDEEEEMEIEIELEHPLKIEIEFEDDEAEIKIRWPRRIERLTLKGDDLEEIIEELAERTGFSAKFLRAKIKIKVKD